MHDSMNKLFALLPLKPLTTLWFSMLTSKETLMGSIPEFIEGGISFL